MNDQLIEYIHARLERIESKLDNISEWKASITGQAKAISLVISVVVSLVAFVIERLLK